MAGRVGVRGQEIAWGAGTRGPQTCTWAGGRMCGWTCGMAIVCRGIVGNILRRCFSTLCTFERTYVQVNVVDGTGYTSSDGIYTSSSRRDMSIGRETTSYSPNMPALSRARCPYYPNTPGSAVSYYRPDIIILEDEVLLLSVDGGILARNGQRPVDLAVTSEFKHHCCGGWVTGRASVYTHERSQGLPIRL